MMLVLNRREGEKLVIDGDITLIITKIRGNQVMIGIEAPKEVKILRGELIIDLPPKEEKKVG